jgi:hypothetical protein
MPQGRVSQGRRVCEQYAVLEATMPAARHCGSTRATATAGCAALCGFTRLTRFDAHRPLHKVVGHLYSDAPVATQPGSWGRVPAAWTPLGGCAETARSAVGLVHAPETSSAEAYALRLCRRTIPGLGHPWDVLSGHASNHSKGPDGGIYRSVGQGLLTRAAAAVRRGDPTNPAPARPPGAGGAGAGGVPQDWRRGTRSKDTVRLPAPWSPPARRFRMKSSALLPHYR